MDWINYMEPSYDTCEIDAVNNYMLSGGWLTEFEKTQEFAGALQKFTGASYCSVMANGTVTLTAALMACDIKPGDEVIVPDFTMSATSHVVAMMGAIPVFVDVEQDTLCMDYACMKAAVTTKTKAVMLVHLNGRCSSKFEDILSFCKENGLWLIEDAAQALGSTYHGKALGTFGDIGSYSFSMPKIITTGQGGAVVTNNPELINKMLRIRDFGREKTGSDHYVMIGGNFKFTDLQAVIGIEQLKKLPARVTHKKEMSKLYKECLQGISDVVFIDSNLDDIAPCFIEIICQHHRDELIEFLKQKNIGTRAFYPPLHAEPAYGYTQLSFPHTEMVAAKGLWLPSSMKIGRTEITYICSCIREFYEQNH